MSIEYSYDGSHRLDGITTDDGELTTLTYSSGKISTIETGTCTTTFTVTSGDLVKIENPDDGVRTLTYDADSRLTKEEFANLVGSVSYDAYGLVDSFTVGDHNASEDEGVTTALTPALALGLVVNMDEQPIQLVSESRNPLPMRPGSTQKMDYEYVRDGMCNVFMFVEPLGGWREVHVSSTRTALDWAGYIKWLVDHPRFADAERIILVCDNLNTHAMGSLYAAFPAEEAFRLMSKLQPVFTPRHGSWLNVAKP